MKTAAPHRTKDNGAKPGLYLACDLGEKTWKLGFTTGAVQRPQLRTAGARNVGTMIRVDVVCTPPRA